VKPTTVPSESCSWQPSLPSELGDMGCGTLMIEQEALWPGARVVPGEQERVTEVQPLKPSQKSWAPLKLAVAPRAPLMLRMVKEILQAPEPVPPMYTAFVTSTMGVWVAVLVDTNMNQATSDAATTAEMVIKTVTIGGIPPNLLLPATPTTLTV